MASSFSYWRINQRYCTRETPLISVRIHALLDKPAVTDRQQSNQNIRITSQKQISSIQNSCSQFMAFSWEYGTVYNPKWSFLNPVNWSFIERNLVSHRLIMNKRFSVFQMNIYCFIFNLLLPGLGFSSRIKKEMEIDRMSFEFLPPLLEQIHPTCNLNEKCIVVATDITTYCGVVTCSIHVVAQISTSPEQSS